MKRVRDAITFHYLTEAVKAARDAPLTVSVGSRTLDWCFEAADRIADAIMVRDAIGIETYPIDQPEVDQVAERLQTIAEDLMNFSATSFPGIARAEGHRRRP